MPVFDLKTQTLFCALLGSAVFLRADIPPLKRAAEELANGIRQRKGATVAVLVLPHHDNHRSDGPFVVSEQLATFLVKDKRLSVLERNHMISLLQELHLSETGVLDTKSTRRIGQALGADVIVTGTLVDLDNHKTEMNARGLLAENGRIIAASRAILDRTWEGRPVLGGDSSSVFSSVDALKLLSRKLKVGLKSKDTSVAVLNFTYSRGRTSTGSDLVSERLVTYLVQCGVPVIERRLIPKILEEKELCETGVVNSNSLKQAGQILGVETAVVGTLTDLSEDATDVMARLIRVDTAEILATASVVIPRLWRDMPHTRRMAQMPVPVAYPLETGSQHTLSDLDSPVRSITGTPH